MIFATPAAAAAIPPNPSKAATSATMKKIRAQRNIATSSLRAADSAASALTTCVFRCRVWLHTAGILIFEAATH